MDAPETFYPSARDATFKYQTGWMEGKVVDDNLGSKRLWRVHDNLYDLTGYMARHPGGHEWLELTAGTDVTEAFESAHVDILKARTVLAKYFVRKADTPRNVRFTFEKDGFYATLRDRVLPILKQVGGNQPEPSILMFQNLLLILFIGSLSLAAFRSSLPIAVVSGLILGMLMGLSHNFFHNRTTWRTYLWDLAIQSSRDWRISHHLSHHMYTGTFYDIEISAWEPFCSHLPWTNKSWIMGTLAPYYNYFFLYFLIGFFHYAQKFVLILLAKERLRWENLLPLAELALIHSIRTLVGSPGQSEPATFSFSLALWTVIQACCIYWFVGTSIFSAHHHPDIYRAGDIPRSQGDWGVFQLDATRDIEGKSEIYWLKMTTFGDHQLHHLFPTIDHSKLYHLYPVFRKTCMDFGIDEKLTKHINAWEMFVGHSQVLGSTKTRDNNQLYKESIKRN